MSGLGEKLSDLAAKAAGKEPYITLGELFGRYGLFRPFLNLCESWAKRHPPIRMVKKDDFFIISKGGFSLFWPQEYDPQSFVSVWKEVRKGHPHDYLQFYKSGENDVVLDIGACEGFFGLRIIDTVHCMWMIEPVPRLSEALKRTFSPWIDRGKVLIETVALSDREGESSFEIPLKCAVSGQLCASDSMQKSQEQISCFTVSMETLDGFVRRRGIERLDLVKMDVEGAEVSVLDGAGDTLRRLRPDLLVCAYHKTDDYETIRLRLEKYGYTVRHSRVVQIRGGGRPYYRYALIFASCR